MLQIIETFTSVQGESTHAGKVCFFIRLAGCNLRCTYCDTAYAWEGGKEFSVEELVSLAVSSGVAVVEITGGEPLLQKETPLLAQKLLEAGKTVLIETNGSVDFSILPEGCCRIVDCKLPASGMAEHNCYAAYSCLTSRDEVKFVVSDRNDFEFAETVIEKYHLADKTPHLLFSPVWDRVKPETLAQWVISSPHPVRMQIQMHKVIWGDRKGV
ncbi:MAG: radical SAM protein [Lentisphaeria bacterium]|nr:radical SAM protein [Lentisphaeria bacterium]